MKRLSALLLGMVLLCGCTKREVMETVADEWVVPVMAQPKQIQLDLPGEASVSAMENDNSRLYIADGYEIAVMTLDSGDLDETLEVLTGFSRDALTVMQTQSGDVKRYEFAWATIGENGDRIGRGVILDDGEYHYCLSVLKDAQQQETSQVIWSQVFHSFQVV